MDKRTSFGSEKRTIVRIFCAYTDYPYQAIAPDILNRFQVARSVLEANYSRDVQKLTCLLECFLQISGQQLTTEGLLNDSFESLYRTFLGALHSDVLIDRKPEWRSQQHRSFNALIGTILTSEGRPFDFMLPADRHSCIRQCVREFSILDLEAEKVWLWRGFVTETRAGTSISLPLYPLYRKLGRSFTEKLFSVCDTYCRARRGFALTGLKQLTEFIGAHSEALTPSHFLDEVFMTSFWRAFLLYYMTVRFDNGNGLPVSSLKSEWRKRLVHFVRHALEPSGLFAPPMGGFPMPEADYVPGSRTNVRTTEDGHNVKVKLVTDVPLHVTDEEALQLLFYQIEADRDLFVRWGEWAVENVWGRYERCQRLAPTGTVRHIRRGRGPENAKRSLLTDRGNPQHLANAAATLKCHGFDSDPQKNRYRYPRPLPRTAHDLALPITDTLFPHCVLLVADHPQITPSFLETLQLFDRNGKLTGFTNKDGVYYLVSNKYRRGARLAEQKIELSSRATDIVRQMIAITTPVREFLQRKGDDNWRYLLLSCGKAFGYPRRITDLSVTTSNPERAEALADSLGNISDLPVEQRRALARRFSLVALRSSTAVLVYLRSGSVEEMSKALGHASFDDRLLSSYLPDPIAAFFQERWVRIFQTGIVAAALEGSPYRLQALPFRNMDELDEFLRNHALKEFPKEALEGQRPIQSSNTESRIAFGLDASVLTALLSLKGAADRSVRQVCAKARYWASLTERLISVIDSELTIRPDIKGYLAEARAKADPNSMERFLYG